ncbi:MAG: hypothetical protein ACXVIP_04655 [Halobacteriota archaeon]
MKSKAALLVVVAVIASIFAAGCTSSVDSSSSQSAAQNSAANQGSTSTNRDKILQAVINDDEQAYVNATWTRTVNKSVRWINDTAATVTYKIGYSKASTLKYTAKYLKFNDDDKAREYVSSINRGYDGTTAMSLMYNIALTTASSLNNHQNYERATGRLPTTNAYEKVSGQGTAYDGSYIIRVNEVVVTYKIAIPRPV